MDGRAFTGDASFALGLALFFARHPARGDDRRRSDVADDFSSRNLVRLCRTGFHDCRAAERLVMAATQALTEGKGHSLAGDADVTPVISLRPIADNDWEITGGTDARNAERTFLPNSGKTVARLTSGLLGFASVLALSLPAAAQQSGGKFLADNCRDALHLNPMANYDNGSCQSWKLVPGPDGWSRLQLKRSGKYLDAKNCTDELNMNPGSNYDGGSCQLWKLVPAADGWSRVQIKRNGKYLQSQNCAGDVQIGELSDASGGAFQLWRLVPVEDSGGWSRLQIKCTGGGGPVAGGNGGPPPVASGDGGDEEYQWSGDTYGWYDDGWDGPGWYIVGYEFRRGFGFGGREGWHNWHHHGSHHHGGHHAEHHEHHEGGQHGGHGHEHHGGGGHHGGGHAGGHGGHHAFVHRGGGHRGGGGGHRGGGGGRHGGGGHRGGGGGHRGGGRRSDIRLKHDIVLLGRLDNGLGFYRFSYNGSDKAYVGVMAQEVQAVMPGAIVRGRDGYLRVYYDRLGLRIQTWEAWVAAGRKIPSTAPGL